MPPKIDAALYYDGACPFCRRYADFVKLRQTIDLRLLDARTHKEALRALKPLDINEGMILCTDGDCCQGEEAIVWLDGHLRRGSVSSWLHHRFTHSGRLRKPLYGAIKKLRHRLLKLLKKPVTI